MSFRLLSVRRKRALHPSNGTYYYTLQTVENKKAVKKPWYQDLLTAICAKRSPQPLYQRLGASRANHSRNDKMHTPLQYQTIWEGGVQNAGKRWFIKESCEWGELAVNREAPFSMTLTGCQHWFDRCAILSSACGFGNVTILNPLVVRLLRRNNRPNGSADYFV